mmetsp:Transcript_3690/g.11574  ORF Transcript_3690/g.11574 Transcript_3690/m.11574 type:complete len:1144 (-) Transcript_3690:85-3516(-)
MPLSDMAVARGASRGSGSVTGRVLPSVLLLGAVIALFSAPLCTAAVGGLGLPPVPAQMTSPFQGELDDASCNVEEVERANTQQLVALLNEVMNTSFFSLFKVNLEEQCQFWGKVKEVDDDDDDEPAEKCESEFPDTASVFGVRDGSSFANKKPCDLETEDPATPAEFSRSTDPVDRVTSASPSFASAGSASCDVPEFWLDMCSDIRPNPARQHLDLRRNPERWTGYNGSKVWAAIYHENCFSKGGSVSDMCYEERILYRMLSGMHSSINIHIALNFHPPSKKAERVTWAPNAARFDELFAQDPDRLKNLHFAFVVTLRAVKKAASFLREYDYSTSEGDLEHTRTQRLVHRFLDTHILSSCADVFDAFDESLMFGRGESPSTVATLKQNFKGVFRNISKVMDCVTCQKCKLHGKLALLGVGTALKILLLPERLIPQTLTREEVVALINTAGKFSQAIEGIKDLQRLNWEKAYFKEETRLDNTYIDPTILPPLQKDELADFALGMVLRLSNSNNITEAQETDLINRILSRDSNILILAKRLSKAPQKFRRYALASKAAPLQPQDTALRSTLEDRPLDAVVVGAGLAGLTATLTLVDRGARVMLIDKNKFTGGNSAYASSGINAVPKANATDGDSVDLYLNDTVRSSGRNAATASGESLMSVLASRSYGSLEWFRSRVKLPLEIKGQMGGHSAPRTYRPSTGMAGSEMVHAITRLTKQLAKEHPDLLQLRLGVKLQGITKGSNGAVAGVVLTNASGGDEYTVRARNVVLATGGFAADLDDDSLLNDFRPDLMKFQTTNGPFATGDGHKVAMAAGAATIDMDQVQVHPTAFAGSAQKEGDRLTLCAEILRGVGAVMVDGNGHRFANELGKRDYLVEKMSKAKSTNLTFALILPAGGAAEANKHVPHYKKKGLLVEYANVSEVAAAIGIPEDTLSATFTEYTEQAKSGIDPYGKMHFNNVAFGAEDGPFHVGWVTPALHYSLGGIAIDSKGRVKQDGDDRGVVPGLYAAGEITGGVHGVNRLGGNALTECVVFGQLVGETIDLATAADTMGHGGGRGPNAAAPATETVVQSAEKRVVSAAELATHNTKADCWIAAYGDVYDFTDFVEEHPGGEDTILDHAGSDGTEVFDAVHTRAMLDDFEPLGVLKA